MGFRSPIIALIHNRFVSLNYLIHEINSRGISEVYMGELRQWVTMDFPRIDVAKITIKAIGVGYAFAHPLDDSIVNQG